MANPRNEAIIFFCIGGCLPAATPKSLREAAQTVMMFSFQGLGSTGRQHADFAMCFEAGGF